MTNTELAERAVVGMPDDVEPPQQAQRLLRPTTGMLVVVALLVTAIVAALLVGLRSQNEASDLHNDRVSAAHAERDAVLAARLLLGLNQTTGPDTLATLKAAATGEFAEQVDLLADTVSGVLRAGQVQSQGNVAASGVEKSSAKEVMVLLAATALVSNSELPNGELRTFRMVAHMTKVGGTWKVSGMEFLS